MRVFVTALSVTLAVAYPIVIFYARVHMEIGRGILALAGGFIWLSTSGLRHGYRLTLGSGILARHALIVGDGAAAEEVIRLLQFAPDSGYRVMGIIHPSARGNRRFIRNIPVLGPLDDLRRFVKAYEEETLLVAAPLHREHDLWSSLRPLRYAGIDIVDLVSLYEETAQQIPLDHIDDEWLMSAAMNNSVIHVRQIKRLMDIAVSMLGLVLTAPV